MNRRPARIKGVSYGETKAPLVLVNLRPEKHHGVELKIMGETTNAGVVLTLQAAAALVDSLQDHMVRLKGMIA